MKRIGLVGPGRVGRTLAALLPPDQFEVGPVLGASWASSKRAVRELRLGRAAEGLEDFADVEWILITTSEQAFPTICSGLLERQGLLANKVLLHTVGSQTASWAPALRDAGAAVGRLYPFEVFNRPGRSLEGVPFLIGGDPRATRAARAIVRAFGGKALCAGEREGDRAVAAAAMLPDALWDLFDLVVEDLADIGVQRKKAVGALSVLVESATRDYARASRQVRKEPPSRLSVRAATQWLDSLRGDRSKGRLINSIVVWALGINGYDAKKLAGRADFSSAVYDERGDEESEDRNRAEAS